MTAQIATKQKRVVIGALSSTVYVTALYWIGIDVIDVTAVDMAGRLALVARWAVLPGLTLLAFVILVGMARFGDPSVIDGDLPAPGSRMDIDRRCLTNTLEQTLLWLLATTALAVQVPATYLGVIPALAVSFVIGRFLFWFGYRYEPVYRAFGFGATIWPTVVAFAWAIYLWV